MIHVIGWAEEQLYVGSLRCFGGAQENSGFGHIGNERAALQDEIADEIGKGFGGGHGYGFRAEVAYGDHHVVLQIFADAGEIVYRPDSCTTNFICRADSGKQKQLWRID